MADRCSEALAEARRWLGTPYCHRASVRGTGADCLGLVRGVWRVLNPAVPVVLPPYSPDWAEADGGERLWRALALHMREQPDGAARAGDVLLFRVRDRGAAKHLGILSRAAPSAFIHSYPRHGVVETALSAPWGRRVVASFAFP
mgnify:CR=1 FL=1